MSICERFPSLSPFDVREKRASEVFLLIRRMSKKINNENTNKLNTPHYKKVGGKTRIYVPVS